MIPLLAVAGYGTSALVAAAIVALKAGRVVVPRVAEWESPPSVRLDPALASLYPHLLRAAECWERLGHTLGAVTLGGDSADIRIEPRPANRIRGLALAHVSADFDDESFGQQDLGDDHEVDAPEGVLRAAVIYLDPVPPLGVDPSRVLAHELGHALGFLHCTARLRRADASRGVQVPKQGHLMHPRYEDGGWGVAGLEVEALGSVQARRMERRRARERRGT